MQNIYWIGFGGLLGAVSRYGLSGFVHRLTGASFPWGTLIVNILGSLVIGFIYSLAEQRLVLSSTTRSFLGIGFLGAFTTFSSFSYETVMLLRQNEWLPAFGNVFLNVFLCLAAVWLGIVLSKLV